MEDARTDPAAISGGHDSTAGAGHRTIPPEVRKQIYSPIGSWQTRLLRIQPSKDFASPVICDLLVADLTPFSGLGLPETLQMVEYEALSYSWGYPFFTHSIFCKGTRFPVSENVYDALRHLRKAVEVRYLWCDACCIDQANLAEKARQIEGLPQTDNGQVMFPIFQKASKVVAWLGIPSSVEDDFLLEYMQTDGNGPHSTVFPSNVNDARGSTGHTSEIRTEHDNDNNHKAQEVRDQELTRLSTAALNFMTSKAYFRRCWIRQEVQAARNLELICGRYSYSFDQFADALSRLLHLQRTARWFRPEKDEPVSDSRVRLLLHFFMRDFQTRSQQKGVRDWFLNLVRSTVYETALPQDKIYSMLGVEAQIQPDAINRKMAIDPEYDYHSEEDSDQEVPPRAIARPQEQSTAPPRYSKIDYQKSVSLVFQEFIKYTIRIEKSLGCLASVQDRRSIDTDLPSWAIDLRVDVRRWKLSPDSVPDLLEQDYDSHGVLVVKGRRLRILGSPSAHPGQEVSPSVSYPYPYPWSVRPLLLRDCLTGQMNKMWMGYERGQIGYVLPEITSAIQKECNYKWMTLPDMPLSWSHNDMTDPTTLDVHKSQFYALVSNLVQDGDLLVALRGANTIFVLRQASGNRYIFLGPAMCYIAVYLHPKVSDADDRDEKDRPNADPETEDSSPTFYCRWFDKSQVIAYPPESLDIPEEEFLLV